MTHWFQFLNIMVMLKIVIEPLYELAVLVFVSRLLLGRG
jgi:hypothetical protein